MANKTQNLNLHQRKVSVRLGKGVTLSSEVAPYVGYLVDQVICRLKKRVVICQSLEEYCALRLVHEAHQFEDDIADLEILNILVHLQYFWHLDERKFSNVKLWQTLACLLKVCYEEPTTTSRVLVTNFARYEDSQLDVIDVMKWTRPNIIQFVEDGFEHAQFVSAEEIGRKVKFSNGVVLETWRGGQIRANYSAYCAQRLHMSGDVELNPGPVVLSKPKRKIDDKYVSKQFIQRLLEREKTKRKKNREKRKTDRYAEGLFSLSSMVGAFIPEEAGVTNKLLQEVLVKLRDVLDSIEKKVKASESFPIVEVAMCVIGLVLALLERAWATVSFQLLNLARLCTFPIMTLFSACFGGGENRQAQSEDDCKLEPVNIFKFMYGFIYGTLIRDCSVTSLFRQLQSFGRAALGFKSLKELANFFFDKVASLYVYLRYGLTWEQYTVMKMYPEIEQVYAACELIRTLKKEQIFASVLVAEEILAVHKKILDMSVQTAIQNDTMVRNRLKEFSALIAPNVALALASPARAHYIRQEPTAIYVYGRPGTGKTTMLEVLHARLWKRYWQEECGFQSSMYTRESVNEFWDGYAGQPCVLLDDFANVIDVKGNPNPEYKELIGMVNNCQFPLHMAALGEKANTFFRSKFIMASSNLRVPLVSSMSDAGAILRRFHVYAEVNIVPEAGELVDGYYRYDPTKNTTDKQLRTDHYVITLYKPVVGEKNQVEVVRRDLSFEDFWDHLVDVIDNRTTRSKSLQKEIAEQAGFDLPDEVEAEKEIMAKFSKVFDVDRMLSVFADNIEDDDGSWFPKRTNWRESFSAFVGKMRTKLISGLSAIKRSISASLDALSDFIFALIPGSVLRVYLDFAGYKSLAVAAISSGLAYFAYKVLAAQPLCQFFTSLSGSPCLECRACVLVNFPMSGHILTHLVGALTPALLNGLQSIGVNVIIFQSKLLQRVARSAESLRRSETPVRAAMKFAEGRIYSDAQVRRTNAFAESAFVQARTPIMCGDVRFAEMDQVQVEQVTQVLLKNSVWIDVVGKNGMSNKANGVFLVGRTLLTTAHTVMSPVCAEGFDFISIYNPYAEEPSIKIPYKECKISQCHAKDGKTVDLALITFPNCVPSRRRILSKFVASDQLDNCHDGNLVMSGFKKSGSKLIVEERYIDHFSLHFRESQYYLHKPNTCPSGERVCSCDQPRVSSHLEYGFATGPGFCGSLLSLQNKALHSKLVGIHVAGGTNVTGIGAVTTRQFLERNLELHVDHFKIPDHYMIDGRLPYANSLVDTDKVVSMVEKGDCLSVGTCERSEPSLSTKLNPSLIQGELQTPITAPAVLRPILVDGQRVDPMEKGILKVLGPQVYMDSDLLSIAVEDVFSLFQDDDRSILTYEETITGVEGNPYIRAINRSTSPGFPYMFENPGKGKEKWMGTGQEFVVDNAELRKDYDCLMDLARQGIRGDAISVATLKDERRPLEKVRVGKTRVFEACPQHLALALRQYYGTFIACVMRGRIDNEICVGINPYSLEWTRLAFRLLEKGNLMIAGDFSNFDGSLTQQVVSLIGEYIDRWYGDGNSLIRAALWEHVSNADVLVGSDIIRQTHSQPSGNPLTVIVNSIFNCIIMRLAYLKLRQENIGDLFCEFRDQCSLVVYGDDNIISVKREIANWFTPEALTRVLGEFGLTYTDEHKQAMAGFRGLEYVSFLKRSFELRDGVYWAPMEVENILEIANWIRGKTYLLSTSENLENCLRELALHRTEVYDKYKERIRKLVSSNNLVLRVPSYLEWQSKFRHDMESYEVNGYDPTLW